MVIYNIFPSDLFSLTKPFNLPVDVKKEIQFNNDVSTLSKDYRPIQEAITSTASDITLSLSQYGWSGSQHQFTAWNAIIYVVSTVIKGFQWPKEIIDLDLDEILKGQAVINIDFKSKIPRISVFSKRRIEELSEFIREYEHESSKKCLAEAAIQDHRESFEQIRSLNLSARSLSILPDSFSLLGNLSLLDLSANNFDKIPEVIYRLDNLKVLVLKCNQIKEISSEEVNKILTSNLKELEIIENPIKKVPSSLGGIVFFLPSFNSYWVD